MGTFQDRLPILLDGDGMRRGSTLFFRFEIMWFKLEGFKDLFKRWWLGYNIKGYYSFILVVKWKALKSNSKS